MMDIIINFALILYAWFGFYRLSKRNLRENISDNQRILEGFKTVFLWPLVITQDKRH